MVLTPLGLILRKEAKEQAKIHEIISFHQPLSLTPSDTFAIGLHGMSITGSSPLAVTIGSEPISNSSNRSSHPPPLKSQATHSEGHHSTGSGGGGGMMVSTIDDDWVCIDISRPSSLAVSPHSPVVVDSSLNNNNKMMKTRFTTCYFEIAFHNKDELNEWMDIIYQQYDYCRGNE
jgi:hypothetical protein